MPDADALSPDPRTTFSTRADRGLERGRISLLLFLEGASLLAVSLVHRGVLVRGYAHGKAAVAETVIGTVLLAGAALAGLRGAGARTVGIAAQAFALLGTLVGLFTIAVGVGPRTAPDLAYHAFILTVLVAGLSWTVRSRRRHMAFPKAPPPARP